MIKRNIKRTSLLVATLALITACAQTSTTTSQKPTSSQKPTTPTTEPTHEKTLTSVSVATTPSKTEYELGTKLNLAGAQLKITYSDGSTETVDIKDNMISAVDMNTSGSKTVTVTYKNKTATFKITVKEKPVVVPVSVRFPKEADHVTIGGRLVLAPVISPAGAELVWHSSDEDIATVSNGVVSAKAYGNVIISVTQKGSDEVLATTKVFVLRQTAAPVNWAELDPKAPAGTLKFLSGGTMPNLPKNTYDKIVVAASVGEDQLTLSGLTAKDVEVAGGSATSIIFSGCTITGTLSINKVTDGTNPVRVEIGNGTSVEKVVMNSKKAILTVKKAVKNVEIHQDAKIQGTAPVAQVEVPATETAPAIEVEGKVEKVVNEAKDTKITGTGTVDVVETKADMTLDVDTTIVPKADVTIKNEAKEGSAKLTEGNPVTYDSDVKYEEGEGAANPEALPADEAPKAGDSYLAYNADQLTAAFKKTDATASIILQADIVNYDQIHILSADKVLDLNGHQLKYADNPKEVSLWSGYNNYAYGAILARNKSLTITDSSQDKTGLIEFVNKDNEINAVGIGVADAGTFTLESGKLTVRKNGETKGMQIVSLNHWAGETGPVFTMNGGALEESSADGTIQGGVVVIGEGSTFTLNKGEINIKTGFAITGNGLASSGGTIINVNGGTVEGSAVGIYHPQAGELNITGGEIKARDAVYMKSGTANIKGGTIESTATKFINHDDKEKDDTSKPKYPNPSGTDEVGAAVVLWGQDGYTGDIVFNVPADSTAQIKGGTKGAALYQLDKFRASDSQYHTTRDIKNESVLDGHVKTPDKDYFSVGSKESMKAAFASEVEDVKLVKDFTHDKLSFIQAGKSYTLDLNGKKLAYIDEITLGDNPKDWKQAFFVLGNLTIKDSVGTGTIEFPNNKAGYGVQVRDGGHFTLDSGTLTVRHVGDVTKYDEYDGFTFIATYAYEKPGERTDDNKVATTVDIKGGKITDPTTGKGTGWGVTLKGWQATLNMTGGEIDLKNPKSTGISGDGTLTSERDTSGTLINIKGGKVSAGLGIYHPQGGVLEMTGGEITGVDCGIEMRAGDLRVKGGKITATTSEATSSKPNGSGPTTVGAGIAVAQHTTKLPISVGIWDGEVIGKTAVFASNPQGNAPEDQEKVNIGIEGGKFSSELKPEYIMSGYKAEKAGESWVVVEDPTPSTEGGEETGA